MTTLTPTPAPATTTLDEYRDLLDRAFDNQVKQWTAEAEEVRELSAPLIEHLGRSGVFSEKWGDGQQPDVAKLIELAFALAATVPRASAGAQPARFGNRPAAALRKIGPPAHDLRTGGPRRGCALHRGVRGIRRFGPADRGDRSAYGPLTDSRSRASRSSSPCPQSPITSWWWPATSTRIRPAGTATSSSSRCRRLRSRSRRPIAR